MSDIHVVVGSGVAGIVASYFEAMKGNRVILIESDDRPGGLLKSDFSNNCYFDYGIHVYAEQTYAIIVSKTHTMIKKHLTGYANDVHPVNGIHHMD